MLGNDVDMKSSAEAVVAFSGNSNFNGGGRWKERVAVGRLADSGEWLRSLSTKRQHNVPKVV